MANIKFTDLAVDTNPLLSDDKIPFVDIADNSMGSSGTNKTVSAATLSDSVATLMSNNKLSGLKLLDSTLTPEKLSVGSPQWNSAGNVQIGSGTSSSDLKLSLGQDRASLGASTIQLFSTDASTPEAAIIKESGNDSMLSIENAGTGTLKLNQIGSGNVAIFTSNSERMRITSNGNIGILKSNPATALDVNGTVTATSYSGGAALTGTPTAPTATPATTSTTQIATTAFVQSAIGNAAITPGTIDDYYRGDKTWQPLNATAVGLGNVTNESKATMFTSPTFTGTVSGISAAMVGLGLVTNTSDANKPVSTAQQTALNLKANIANPTFTGDINLSGTASDYTAAVLTNTSGVQTQLFSNANLNGGIVTVTNHPMLLATNNTERMRISAAGNVGIGKSNPSTALDVNGTVTATAFAGPLTGNVTGIASGNVKQGGGANQLGNVVYMGWSASSQLRVQVDSTDFGVNWPINVSGNANTSSSCSGNSATATLATKSSTLSQNGGTGTAMTFNWIDGGAQPNWVWGGINGANHYVYNPATFSVNYANSAGSAPTQYEEFRLWSNANPPDGSTAWGIAHNSPNWSSYQVFLKRVAASYVSSGYTQAMFSNIPIGTYIELLPDGDYYGRSYITTNRFYVTRTTSGNLTFLEPNINIFNSNSTGMINTPDTPQGAEITFANTDWQMVVRIYS